MSDYKPDLLMQLFIFEAVKKEFTEIRDFHFGLCVYARLTNFKSMPDANKQRLNWFLNKMKEDRKDKLPHYPYIDEDGVEHDKVFFYWKPDDTESRVKYLDDEIQRLKEEIEYNPIIIKIKFEGIDDWNRPIYKSVGSSVRYGSVNKLFPDRGIAPNNTPEEINAWFKDNMYQLDYFGTKFNCEPWGSNIPYGYKLEIVD